MFWRRLSVRASHALAMRHAPAQSGYWLLGSDGSELVVAGLVRTFNFEVEGWHTYFVGAKADQPAVLVHNASIFKFAKSRIGYVLKGSVGKRRWRRAVKPGAKGRVYELRQATPGKSPGRWRRTMDTDALRRQGTS